MCILFDCLIVSCCFSGEYTLKLWHNQLGSESICFCYCHLIYKNITRYHFLKETVFLLLLGVRGRESILNRSIHWILNCVFQIMKCVKDTSLKNDLIPLV